MRIVLESVNGDVNADIAVMENLMKTEGLAEDEINQIKLTLSQE